MYIESLRLLVHQMFVAAGFLKKVCSVNRILSVTKKQLFLFQKTGPCAELTSIFKHV